jgi:hypothetical protein
MDAHLPDVSPEKLAEIKAYSLSNDDIQKILEPDTKILTYPDFCHMRHIDQAFDKLGRCIFLFLTEGPNVGHWITMFKRPRENAIEYFDSYGQKPEAQRDWLTEEKLHELGESEPCLWNLLKKSKYKVFYNTVPYQSDRNAINTCGRWGVARLICKDLSNKDFYTLIDRSGCTPDDWVALFTYGMLGK